SAHTVAAWPTDEAANAESATEPAQATTALGSISAQRRTSRSRNSVPLVPLSRNEFSNACGKSFSGIAATEFIASWLPSTAWPSGVDGWALPSNSAASPLPWEVPSIFTWLEAVCADGCPLPAPLIAIGVEAVEDDRPKSCRVRCSASGEL